METYRRTKIFMCQGSQGQVFPLRRSTECGVEEKQFLHLAKYTADFLKMTYLESWTGYLD
jgi:hypothetical protein